MKIGEVEQCTGVTAKNIRFYEKEGLLQPARQAHNGYREYTQDDVEVVKQIKLLRELGVSLDHIRRLRAGEITMRDCMDLYVASFESEIAHLQYLKSLCDDLKDTDLPRLNVDRYLDEIEAAKKRGRRFVDIVHDCTTRCRNILPDPAFHFEPHDPITKASEFVDELMRYAKQEGLSLDIRHTGMEPIAYLDGKKYLFVLDLPHYLEFKGPLRWLLNGMFVYTRWGYKIVYAYPCQL